MFIKRHNNYEQNTKRIILINYLQKELQSCSTHGVPFIVKTEIHWFERYFWSISYGCSIVFAFILLSPLYTRYVESPTVMSVEMDYVNWNVSYPALTLCPQNKIDEEALAILVEDYANKTGVNVTSLVRVISTISLDNLEFMDLKTERLSMVIPPEDYATVAAKVYKKMVKVSLTTNTNWPISVETAMTEKGICHVINSNVAVFDNPLKWRADRFTSKKYVKTNIELSVHDGDFFTQIQNYDNFYKVYIHSPNEIVQVSTASYSHGNGFLSIGVEVWSTRATDVLRASPIKVRKCRLVEEPVSKRYPVYSYNHCMLECRINMMKLLCGCIPHFYKALDNERICSIPELSCIIHYKKEISTFSSNPVRLSKFANQDISKPSIECGCLSSCETDVYLKYYESLQSQIEPNRLRVGISAFPKVRVVREIKFGFTDIILRSGSVINLCTGSSIISIMELVLLIIKIHVKKLIQYFQYNFNFN